MVYLLRDEESSYFCEKVHLYSKKSRKYTI
jgi:hypothetical protein